MLYNSNIIAFVGTGQNPKYPLNRLVFWDQSKSKEICNLTYNCYIISIKLKEDKIFVICEQKIYVHSFNDFKLVESIDTFKNTKGLFSVNTSADRTLIAFLEKNIGSIKIKNYNTNTGMSITTSKSAPAYFTLNNEGIILATSSERVIFILFYINFI